MSFVATAVGPYAAGVVVIVGLVGLGYASWAQRRSGACRPPMSPFLAFSCKLSLGWLLILCDESV
jgi:hypothetical protein